MEQELGVLVDAMRVAGRKALELAKSGLSVQTKSDHSPVTSADLAVDRILHDAVSRRFPDDAWLSEERKDDRARFTKKRTWIVDPIDGTRAFIKKKPEFCISAALVENGRVVMGAIFNPSTDELFTAVRGRGIEVSHHPRLITATSETNGLPVVLVNPWEWQHGRYHSIRHEVHCRPLGSIAYALAQVAVGRAAAAVMLDGGNEWDVAAGALLIEESGGRITDARGVALRFNQEHTRLAGLLAMQRDAPEFLQETLQGLAEQT